MPYVSVRPTTGRCMQVITLLLAVRQWIIPVKIMTSRLTEFLGGSSPASFASSHLEYSEEKSDK
jgi:hypothetical protein